MVQPADNNISPDHNTSHDSSVSEVEDLQSQVLEIPVVELLHVGARLKAIYEFISIRNAWEILAGICGVLNFLSIYCWNDRITYSKD